MKKIAFLAVRISAIAVVSTAIISIMIRNIVNPVQFDHFYRYGMTVPAACCSAINATMILVLASLCEGVTDATVRSWKKMEDDVEYYRRRSHELAGQVQLLLLHREEEKPA